MIEPTDGLQRKLNSRMLTMMTIGGSISTGIFLASGNAIYIAGPVSTLLAYSLTGIVIYLLMSSLGEMATCIPSTGSFYVYAEKFVDPAVGYALAWNYWYGWAITVASEMAAASLIMHYWFPNSSPFIWCSLFLSIVLMFNAFSTRVFGEAEYWFSLIKVLIILLFIIAGFALVLGITHYQSPGFQNWIQPGASFHGGLSALLSALIIAGFSFQGTEMVAIAAGECKNPNENIPKAIKQIFWRILVFFILSMLVISLLIPYDSAQLASSDVTMSPFTLVFKQYHIHFAATLMNMVILIVILSAANSGLYAATRMFWFLAKKGHVPSVFSHVNKRGVPIRSLILTTAITLLSFLSSIFGNGKVYLWLINAVSLTGFIAWLGIAISHYRFRKAYVSQGRDLTQLPFVAKGYPFNTIATGLFCVLVIGAQNYQVFTGPTIDWFNVVISYSGLVLFLAMWLGYKFFKKTKLVDLRHCTFD